MIKGKLVLEVDEDLKSMIEEKGRDAGQHPVKGSDIGGGSRFTLVDHV